MPQRASGALGGLLLNVLAAAPENKKKKRSNFEPRVKNTFLQFGTGGEDLRSNFEPRVKNTFLQFGTGGEDLRRIRTAPPKVAEGSCSSAGPSDGEASDTEPSTPLVRLLTASSEVPAAAPENHGHGGVAAPYGAARQEPTPEACPPGFPLQAHGVDVAWDAWAAAEAWQGAPAEPWADAAWHAWHAWHAWPVAAGPTAHWLAPDLKLHQPRKDRFAWVVNAKKLEGKHTRLTKAGALGIGAFAFTIFPHRVSQKRGGSCFQAADGLGTVQVKCNSAIAGDVLVSVNLSSHAPCCRVMHNFSSDAICKVPRTWNFGDAVDVNTGEFFVTFEFTLMGCQALT